MYFYAILYPSREMNFFGKRGFTDGEILQYKKQSGTCTGF